MPAAAWISGSMMNPASFDVVFSQDPLDGVEAGKPAGGIRQRQRTAITIRRISRHAWETARAGIAHETARCCRH